MFHTTIASMDLDVATDGLVLELFCCCLMKDSFDKDYCVFMDNFYSSPALRCRVCCASSGPDGKKLRKETRFFCRDCNAPLCPASCFELFHKKISY